MLPSSRFLALLALVFLFQGTRPPGVAAEEGSARRRLQDGPLYNYVLTVDPSQQSSAPGFLPKKMGGYRSEERLFWDKVYDPANTLGPLFMVSNRMQIALTDLELGPDGSFVDPKKTQFGIIQKIAASVNRDLFITVGYPWSSRAQNFVKQGLPDGWEQYWRQTYSTLAAALAGEYWTGKPVWIEIFGEPDFSIWSYVYGSDPNKIFRAAKIAYDAFARYPGKFNIGGCGFALPLSSWVSRFLDYARANGMQLDFLSYHHYIGWTDRSNPALYGRAGSNSVANVGFRNSLFRRLADAKGFSGVPIIISEYAWQDADLSAASGFGERAKSARETLTHYQSCARTLAAIDIVAGDPSIVRAYWAQGVGKAKTPENQPSRQWLYAYNPFVVYIPAQDTWRYKASYYAFWIYGRMQGMRVAVQSSDASLGTWAAVGNPGPALRIAVWNRSSVRVRSAALALPGVANGRPATLYRIDDTTYRVGATDPLNYVLAGPKSATPPTEPSVQTVGDALRFLAQNPLQPEAAVFLVVFLA